MTEERGIYVIDLGPALPDCPADRLEPPWFAVGELERTIDRQAKQIMFLYERMAEMEHRIEQERNRGDKLHKAAKFYCRQYRRLINTP